jgi:membrane-bound lytic murein transglycosylase D
MSNASVAAHQHERATPRPCNSTANANKGRYKIFDGQHARVRTLRKSRQWIVATACAPLLLLAGCPQQQSVPSPVAANATAPAIAVPAQQTADAAAASQQAAELAAKAQKVQQLIGKVEGTYTSGVDNYRAGRLQAARSDFDSSVDLMLTSGMDLKTDPRLSDEFEHLLNSINSLEMSALKQGTGFSAPIEAAPLDAADEVTFPPDAALTAQVKEELKTTQSDFPLVINDYVAGFIHYFSNSPTGHAHLLRSLERAGKYKDMISKVLGDEGVPQDLIYLAVAESGFQPQALNGKSGAGGMWQFMPTGAYGLARNGWVDERFDPEKSSRAYAKYIKSLYNQFGDWYLAMAAYDWGPGYVQRSVMRTGYADYWELYKRNVLPQETKNYVPGIIAAIIMAKNPKQYGLEGLVPDPAVVSDTVTVDYSVDLRLVADVTDAPLSEIIELNPSLLHMNTPRDGDFDLHLPMGTHDAFLKRIQGIPEDKRTSWRFHVVRPGESLDSIATSFHDRPAEIASASKRDANALIAAGDELVVPVATAVAMPHPLHYVTRLGDTLVTIADRFNVSVEDIRRWNHLSSTAIKPQRTLFVSQPVHLAPVTHVRAKKPGAATTTHVATGAKATSPAKPSTSTAKTSSHSVATKKKPQAKPVSASR